MIERIRFTNFKVLKNAEIKLGPFNLIIGPNGSGKSTVFQALHAAASPEKFSYDRIVTLGCASEKVSIDVTFDNSINQVNRVVTSWSGPQPADRETRFLNGETRVMEGRAVMALLRAIRVFALDPAKIAEAVTIQPGLELQRTGANLAGVLDDIRNTDEEAFDAIRSELNRWVPEYDSITFATPQQGQRSFKLRRRYDKELISASDLSEGTLTALYLITIANSSTPPPLICLEEPDRALHPRLLEDVREALYRLSFPSDFGLQRKPVQVIATTHSPLFLDLFKGHPEQIIIAEKHPDASATFKSLGDDIELQRSIGDAPLGDVWYSGILGGVPALS